MTLKSLTGINKKELSMIEVAHALLEEKGAVMTFNDILLGVQDYLELNDDELERRMSIFYTELNIDGSFISLGENRWGLRSWYAIDSIDEELVSAFEEETTTVRRKKRKKLNAFVTSDDDVDYSNDDPEDMDEIDDEDDIDREIDDEDDDTIVDYDLVRDMDDEDAIEDDLTIISDDDAFSDL